MKHILIVEDVRSTRDWLISICTHAFPDATCQAVDSLTDALASLHRIVFDLAILDLDLPDGSGLDLISPIHKHSPHAICIVATISGDNMNIVKALAAGAEGYLLKEQHEDLLIAQLKQISMGIPALSPQIAHRLITHFKNTGPLQADHNLTRREAEVLSLIGRGLRNREVSEALGISPTTVAGYIKSVYRKLGISSRAEAAWHAKQFGL